MLLAPLPIRLLARCGLASSSKFREPHMHESLKALLITQVLGAAADQLLVQSLQARRQQR